MKRKAAPATVRMPDEWRENFRSYSLRTSFQLALSRPMLEFLCAVSDDVRWDRAAFAGLINPDNWMAASQSLFKRGLICRKSQEEIEENWRKYAKGERPSEFLNHWQLTPAGDLVVNLLKITGLFVEADAAITKKARKA